MRYRLLFALLASCVSTATAVAQGYPSVAVVMQPEVEVRSGPSKSLFATSKLKRGDRVMVLRECKDAPGWLEIEPPAGSFSWINGKYVKMVKDDPRHAVVDADPSRPAPVMPGSTEVNQAPNKEILRHVSGTIVVIVDRPLTAGGETWLPIKVHPGEVRYLPAEAVQGATQVAANNTAAPNWILGPNGSFSTNPLIIEGDKALEKGDRLRAQQLYQQVVDTSTDPNQKQLALNKLRGIQQGTFQPTSAQRPGDPVTAFSPQAPVSNLQTLKGPEWSTYGRLRETPLKRDDGQPIFALVDQRELPIAYVTTAPGKSLQTYVGRMVSVYGPTVYRPDASARLQYIVATHVASP